MSFSPLYNAKSSNNPIKVTIEETDAQTSPKTPPIPPPLRYLVHWKGEGEEGYSMQFRHDEWKGALKAVNVDAATVDAIAFINALDYFCEAPLPDVKRRQFQQSMQYVEGIDDIPIEKLIEATERCSLVHTLFGVLAQDCTSYQELADTAVGLQDMQTSSNTWCVRVRHYNRDDSKRYGARTRSCSQEKDACIGLQSLLRSFGGTVCLQQPDCKLYVLHDMVQPHDCMLVRRLASGAVTHNIAPKTRLCITTTPLCPIAAYSLVNIAQVRTDDCVLDPYCGSATTLLAAAQMATNLTLVGIEINHNGHVNRTNIVRDFTSRNLPEPAALIRGDCTQEAIRDLARRYGGPFDVIVTDPPYGIREVLVEQPPMESLLQNIIDDRQAGKPLLKQGGRITAFLPCRDDQDLERDVLPNVDLLEEAGLKLTLAREQPLNEHLSRWLCLFESV